MKAVRIHEYGGPEVLRYEDAPDPTIGDDDVLVSVHAASVTPIDWKIREGMRRDRNERLPLILGWDVSGVVETVGANVTRFKMGDAVYGRPDIARDGMYAELAAVRANELARKPASLDHIHAAAVPLTALTAWQSLFEAAPGFQGANLRAGQTVLIHAAAGGVGTFAVQLAKERGARVVGTCSARNADYVRSLGADVTIDYETTRFEDVVKDVDVVMDYAGGDVGERSWRVLKKGGILVSITTHHDEAVATKHGVRTGYVFVQPSGVKLEALAAMIDAGKLRVFVSGVLPLSRAREAHEASQARHVRGKIVLRVV